MATGFTTEQHHFCRICRLLLDYGTAVLVNVLDSQLKHQYPSQNFEDILNINVVKSKLGYVSSFNEEQQLLLYPSKHDKRNLGAASKTVQCTDLDISLSCILLRNVCGLKPPSDPVWIDPPQPSDNSLEANITRLRIIRNTIYGHKITASMSKADFICNWDEIVTVLLDLSNIYSQADYDNLKTAAIDVDTELKYDKVLEQWKNQETNTSTKILKVTEDLQVHVERNCEKTEECLNKVLQLHDTLEKYLKPDKRGQTDDLCPDDDKKRLKLSHLKNEKIPEMQSSSQRDPVTPDDLGDQNMAMEVTVINISEQATTENTQSTDKEYGAAEMMDLFPFESHSYNNDDVILEEKSQKEQLQPAKNPCTEPSQRAEVIIPQEFKLRNYPNELTMQKNEFHYDLICKIEEQLTSYDFRRVKLLAKAYKPSAGLWEKIDKFPDLVEELEKIGIPVIWTNGGYSKLINIFTKASLPKLVELINQYEDKINKAPVELSEGGTKEKKQNLEDCESSAITCKANDSCIQPSQRAKVTIPQDFKLRNYQNELTEAGLNGKNVIICAPTGSGKTHVALHICKAHLKKSSKAKVVFFCNQVALAEQQWEVFRKFLSEYKSIALTGENTQSSKGPLDAIIEQNAIIVMTPQIIVDSIKKQVINTLSETFTLMIFDECHHTNKKHPYNLIMNIYLEDKFQSIKDETHVKMPQVIGLTASLGVGKANTVEKAREHILSLCANLDVEKVCTVENNLEELQRHCSVPVENTCVVNKRTNDPFFNAIQEIMTKIEQNMQQSPDAQKVTEVPNFSKELQPPHDKGSDQYTQWASNLRGKVVRIYEQKARRLFLESVNHLMAYNEALLLGENCRKKDALNLLKEEFKSGRPVLDEIDSWLDGLFKDKLALFEELGKTVNNPKLAKLQEMILEAYKEKSETHGIIFAETRVLTLALKNWISETSDLKWLNPGTLVGAGAAADKGGMTQRQQVNLLKRFREGNHKIIIATSVAEEGLDIRSCNLVIRYLHVTNEIAMIQARGRARVEDSRYMVLAEAGSGVVEKEQINIIRENMMKNALNEIKKMSKDEFNKQKNKYQEEARFQHSMQTLMAPVPATNSENNYQLRCLKCDNFACMSFDFRTVCKDHHVVIDEGFKERIQWKMHPRPQVIIEGEFEKLGKIYCAKCEYEWGIEALHNGAKFPVLKIQSFILVDFREKRLPLIKKWKNAPFTVLPLTLEDLRKKLTAACSATE